jgi:hypothetical protein
MRQRWVQAGKPSAYSPEGYKTIETGLKWWDSFFWLHSQRHQLG